MSEKDFRFSESKGVICKAEAGCLVLLIQVPDDPIYYGCQPLSPKRHPMSADLSRVFAAVDPSFTSSYCCAGDILSPRISYMERHILTPIPVILC